jgi:excisionase family DNA binding protein
MGTPPGPADIRRMHTSSPDPSPDQPATETLLTASELARRFSVSQGWVYQAVADGRLPHIRLGRPDGPVRFVGSDIDAWLEAQRLAWAPGHRR